jgi:hypothetical protein
MVKLNRKNEREGLLLVCKKKNKEKHFFFFFIKKKIIFFNIQNFFLWMSLIHMYQEK